MFLHSSGSSSNSEVRMYRLLQQVSPHKTQTHNRILKTLFWSFGGTSQRDLEAMRFNLLNGEYTKVKEMVHSNNKNPNTLHPETENPVLSDLIRTPPEYFKNNRQDTFKFIVEECGAKLDVTCDCPGNRTALHYALEAEHGENVAYEDVRTLCKLGASVNLLDCNNQSPLDYALMNDIPFVYAQLVSFGGEHSQYRANQFLDEEVRSAATKYLIKSIYYNNPNDKATAFLKALKNEGIEIPEYVNERAIAHQTPKNKPL